MNLAEFYKTNIQNTLYSKGKISFNDFKKQGSFLEISVSLVDNYGCFVAMGEIGEILIHSNDSSLVYFTGDTAWKDEAEVLHFTGAKDDIIVSAGYCISPLEIEKTALNHNAVKECAATCVKTEESSNSIKLSVVLNSGLKACDKVKNSIKEYLLSNTAPFKAPKIIEFCEAIPKSDDGRVLRCEIRKTNFAY